MNDQRPRSAVGEPDAETARRMRAGHTIAAAALHARAASAAPEVWGWRGRTLGRPVSTRHGTRWLRLASVPAGQTGSIFWTGNAEAEHSLIDCIPRPRLRRWFEWTDGQHAYRAELHQISPGHTLAASDAVTRTVDPPSQWWSDLRAALDSLAAVPTRRRAVDPAFLAWAMPYHLGQRIDAGPEARWTTAHGDLHFANLCGPQLSILDWEGWGRAPAGYDAATLHCRSLLAPTLAARIRAELAYLLDTPTGWYAELVVVTELLHAHTSHGINPDLAIAVRRRARHLLNSRWPDLPGWQGS